MLTLCVYVCAVLVPCVTHTCVCVCVCVLIHTVPHAGRVFASLARSFPHRDRRCVCILVWCSQAEFFSRLRGRPPLGRLKMFGPKVDLLEHYTQEIAKVNGEVKEARREAIESGFTPSW